MIVHGNVYINYPEKPVKDNRKISSIRSSQSLATFKKKVKARDIHCQCCGEQEKQLQVHHIMGLSDYKELACDTNNGITLCQKCHSKYHKEYDEVNAVTFAEFMKRFAKRY